MARHTTRQTGTTGATHPRWHPHSGVIRRGILTSFDPATYTCSVLLLEATNTYLQSVPIAYHMDGTSALTNNFCAVLFFDQQNHTDALIIAIYPGAGVGPPAYLPGRVTFVPLFTLLNSVTITSGSTNTYTVTGSNHIPAHALGVLVHAGFTSPTAGSWVDITAHGATLIALTVGNLAVASGFINGSGVVPCDSSGRIDVKANIGDCATTIVVYGYVV
jgi:hypothetical protein